MTSEAIRLWAATAAPEREAPSDLELVANAQRGDTEAFSALVERHQHLVFNLAYRFMRDSGAAEDMAQEAFIKAFRLLRGFRGDCSFSTWLYRVTVNVCLTELGRRHKRQEVPLEWGRSEHGTTQPGESTDIPELIRACVGALPDRYRAIITLYYLKETPYEEIAQVLRIPMGTLKTWMHRARHQLRKIVEKELRLHGSA